MAKQSSETETIGNAEAIIKRFGGIRPMATKMGVPVTTVQGWKKRNAIPENRKSEIVKAAASHDVSLKGLKAFADSADVQKTPTKSASKKAEPKKQAKKPASKTSGAAQKTAIKKPAAAKKAAPVKTKPAAKPKAKIEPQAATAAPQTTTSTAINDGHNSISVADLQTIRQESVRSGAIAGTLIAGVITVVGLALFGGGTTPSDTSGTIDPQRVAQLENRLQEVEQQNDMAMSLLGGSEQGVMEKQSVLSSGSVLETMAFLQQQVQDMGATNPQMQEMAAQFDSLSQNQETQGALQSGLQELQNIVSGIQNKVQNLDSEIETTQGRIHGAVNGEKGTDVQAAALLLALGQFRSAVHRNGPIAQDLDIIRGLIGDNAKLNEALDRLAPHADTGVLSVEGLSNQLKVVAGDALMAKLSGEDISLKEKMVQRLNNMVSVSKDGEVINPGMQQPEIIRAQSELARGNIQAAMREVQTLDGVDPALTEPWLEQARATLNAQGVEVMIMQLVLDQIKAFKDGGMGGLQNSVKRAVTETVNDANRILTNPALNLPEIPMPDMQFKKPDIPRIDVPKM